MFFNDPEVHLISSTIFGQHPGATVVVEMRVLTMMMIVRAATGGATSSGFDDDWTRMDGASEASRSAPTYAPSTLAPSPSPGSPRPTHQLGIAPAPTHTWELGSRVVSSNGHQPAQHIDNDDEEAASTM